jgi:hypothetical protein
MTRPFNPTLRGISPTLLQCEGPLLARSSRAGLREICPVLKVDRPCGRGCPATRSTSTATFGRTQSRRLFPGDSAGKQATPWLRHQGAAVLGTSHQGIAS